MKYKLLILLLSASLYADAAPDLVTLEKIAQNSSQVIDTLNNASLGLYSVVSHSEIEYGRGTLSLEGSLFGSDKKISDNVTTYTIKTEHQNTPIKHLNYNYKISYYTAKVFQQEYLSIPAMNHDIKGIDADFGLGWNIVDISKDDYISLGVDVGISLPNIDTSQVNTTSSQIIDTNNSISISNNSTHFTTYKIGAQVRFSKSIIPMLSVYGSAVYASQFASITNKSIDLNIHTSGIFHEEEIGLRLRPIDYKYQITSWFAIHPNLYFTAGIRYSQWIFKDVAINISNTNAPLPKQDFTLSSSTTYVGMGYSF
jgi:hypothetical protein